MGPAARRAFVGRAHELVGGGARSLARSLAQHRLGRLFQCRRFRFRFCSFLSFPVLSRLPRLVSSVSCSSSERETELKKQHGMGRDKRGEEKERMSRLSFSLGPQGSERLNSFPPRLPSNPAPATLSPLSPSLWAVDSLTSAPNEEERVLEVPETGGGGGGGGVGRRTKLKQSERRFSPRWKSQSPDCLARLPFRPRGARKGGREAKEVPSACRRSHSSGWLTFWGGGVRELSFAKRRKEKGLRGRG